MNHAQNHGHIVVGEERLVATQFDSLRDIDARGLLVTLTVASLLLFACAIGFVVWTNVWGSYGESGYFQVYNDRLGKVQAVTQIPRDDLPKAWVIGGSTTYPFLPRFVEERFGYPTYSVSAFWARIQEDAAWGEFITKDLDSRPELIILGLETWSFRPDSDGPPIYGKMRRRLLNTPQLVKHIEEYRPTLGYLSRGLDLLSGQQFSTGVRAIVSGQERVTHRAAGQESVIKFNPDGSGPYAEEAPETFYATPEINKFYHEILLGERSPDTLENVARRAKYIQEHVNRHDLEIFFPGSKLSKTEVRRFQRFVTLCESEQIPLIVILLPVHPLFDDALRQQTQHAEHLATMRRIVTSALRTSRGKHLLVDASDLRSFAGDPTGFHDRLHMKPSNAKRILDIAHARWDDR